MTNVNQHFNVDLRIFYGSQVSQVKGTYVPDSPTGAPVTSPVIYQETYRPSLTDWSRRLVSLPTISKSVENWSGQFETSAVTLELADTDGSVSLRLGTRPFGNPITLWSKVAQNPDYWSPVIGGHITGISRGRGITRVTFYDSFKNVYNSHFIPDYMGLATFIGTKLYGTVKDVIGSNVYIDDRGDIQLIRRKVQDESSGNWLGAVVGAALGAITGAFTGGLAPAIGAAAGFVGNIPAAGRDAKYEYYYKVNDFNAIPDGYIFGGQALKFSAATVSGVATSVYGPLYTIPRQRVRGGQFANGIYGTVELDDLLHGVAIGDYVYAELPLIYFGSPDDIIVNMLCGSNVSVRYEFPKDFCDDWFEQTSALRHIEAYSYVENFERGGVIEAIDSLCKEFGFTFYLDEGNKFAVRMLRQYDVYGSNVIGTVHETYNIVNDGVELSQDVNTSYSDIVYRYKDTYIGNLYEQEVSIVTGAATWFGGQHRVLEVNSKWIHDGFTGKYVAKRVARRYATVNPTIEFETSLYAVPVTLGEILNVTSWSTGTNAKYEIVGYEKDFQNSVAKITAESADFLYKNRGFFQLSPGNKSGLGQIEYSIATSWNQFYLKYRIDADDNHIHMYSLFLGTAPTGSTITFPTTPFPGNNEVMKVLDCYPVPGQPFEFIMVVERGYMNTVSWMHNEEAEMYFVNSYVATCYNMNPAYGTIFRWY